MIFEIMAHKAGEGDKKFFYDNTESVLKAEDGFVFEYPKIEKPDLKVTVPFSKNNPLKKSKNISVIKIQLGLSCNYSCDYCSQRFVERPPETSKKDIDDFMKKLEVLDINEEQGLRIEFWGGEPLVYWKTLKPLAEAFAEKYGHWKKKIVFGMVTNGTLLTREICSWLYYMGFGVGLSHDGPGQHVRGPDPFDDPEKKQIILEFYKVMNTGPNKRMSFNSMMNSKNISRKEIYEYFVELTGDPNVSIGEGGFIDAYDDAAASLSLTDLEEHFNYRRTTFNDIYSTDGKINFHLTFEKVDGFIRSTLAHIESQYVGQKCGMEVPETLAVDLKGNVITCHNVSIVMPSKNGEPHHSGNLEDYENVALTSVTHWKSRDNKISCSDCPVLHICKGSCMYLDGEHWDITCNNAYSDNIVLFALGFERMTGGYIPVTINGEGLPLERQDIWGTVYKHTEKEKKKTFPIKVVSEKIGMVNDVEVYGQTRLEV
jgi:uncharacterized protein